MKLNPKTRRSPTGGRPKAAGVAENTGPRMQMILELLQQLAAVVAANERAQRRFRAAIASEVAKIETTVQMIHGAQIVEAHGYAHPEEAKKHAKDADEFISDASNRLGLAIVNFTYDETAEPAPPRGRNRKWSSWEI